MKRAEKRALELFPVDMQMCIDNMGEPYEADVNAPRRKYVAYGYEQAEKDIISIIKSRLSELLGDAQPTPILRSELLDLIKKITED